jgi:hypothetical protein
MLTMAVIATAETMARGTVRVGSAVSSASPPAASKPKSTHADVSIAARKAPEYPQE